MNVQLLCGGRHESILQGRLSVGLLCFFTATQVLSRERTYAHANLLNQENLLQKMDTELSMFTIRSVCD
jgi:hypothetical protein